MVKLEAVQGLVNTPIWNFSSAPSAKDLIITSAMEKQMTWAHVRHVQVSIKQMKIKLMIKNQKSHQIRTIYISSHAWNTNLIPQNWPWARNWHEAGHGTKHRTCTAHTAQETTRATHQTGNNTKHAPHKWQHAAHTKQETTRSTHHTGGNTHEHAARSTQSPYLT